jgi:kynurenine 3-monooxygenase
MRVQQVEAGRSINLALSERGIRALNEVGIKDEIMRIAIPMHGRYIHNLDGSHAFQPYGKPGQFIYSVSRRDLNCRLMDLAEANDIDFHFDQKCTHIDFKRRTIQFASSPDGRISEVEAGMIFGSDGAYSASRLSHMLQHEKFQYQQHYIDCGYKELSIPPGKDGAFSIEKNALHIWPRKNFMLIALPNLDGSFTGTLFFPFEGEGSFEKLRTEESVINFFNETFADVVPLIPGLKDQFFNHPVSSLVTVKCYPWIREEGFSLIGDAAHAIVPFFGQGMNAGFEDCSTLNELIGKYDDDWSVILKEFQAIRKPDADAIADLAINNFTEMRARTADPLFLLQKKIEARIHEHHPDKWIPAYTQVTFSPHIRYSAALQNSLKQEGIMQDIMRLPDIEEKWDSEEIEQMILARL